jgi:hypothetical protein
MPAHDLGEAVAAALGKRWSSESVERLGRAVVIIRALLGLLFACVGVLAFVSSGSYRNTPGSVGMRGSRRILSGPRDTRLGPALSSLSGADRRRWIGGDQSAVVDATKSFFRHTISRIR